MRILHQVAGILSHWLQHRYPMVALGCFVTILVTFVLKSCLASQCDLIFWRDTLITVLKNGILLPVVILSLPVAWKLFLFASFLAGYHFPHKWVKDRLDERRRMQFADFIVRRLLLQLELSIQRLPSSEVDMDLSNPVVRQNYERAREAGYRAVEIFRRDAKAVLENKSPNSSALEGPHYFVLEEEQQALRRHGYGSIDLRVTEEVLREILRPLEGL
ncbi:uncharacterized protein [Drosophila bipectinata]|uniref:uncharacterized protein n=1 Tax=Drosophila bipectinata TaxID=42026 RepID=UPI0038B3FC3B